jgi:cytoskeletal protein CcmA (bactofilin family)
MKGIVMLSRNRADAPSNKTLTIIAEGVKIEGKLYSKGSTRVDGEVFGEIISENEFIIGREGKVEANIKTNNAIIAGSFKGEMIAAGEIEITATGKFVGNLTQKDALLTVVKGGLFKGQILISEDQDLFKLVSDKPFNAPSQPKLQIQSNASFSYSQSQADSSIGAKILNREIDIQEL